MSMLSSRRREGQSIIETVVGIIFLVPIVLFLFDVAFFVLACSTNDNLVKSACRAAASAVDNSGTGTSTAGKTAATNVCSNFQLQSALLKAPGGSSNGSGLLTGFSYNGSGWTGSGGGTPASTAGQVACITTMQVTLPVPFPLLPASLNIQAKAVEPIVSIPAP